MSDGELWSVLVTSIDPDNTKNMTAVLQSTIHLLESELAKAKAALHEIQPNASPMIIRGEELAAGAMAAYRQNLIGRAPDFYYGTRRLTPKELGLVPTVREIELTDEESSSSEEQSDCASIEALPKPTSLEDVLGNNLILDHLVPYLSAGPILALSATSRYMRSLIHETPYVFRHLDLSNCRGAQPTDQSPIDSGGQSWRAERMDESLTEDEFYSGPLRGIFANLERRSILRDVRTLILDGLSVPADLVSEIILSDRFNINILSIRECRHLNERKLMQALNYAVRPTRPTGTPRVKGIYYFTPMDRPKATVRSRYRDWWSSQCSGQSTPGDVTPSRVQKEGQRQNAWYRPSGKLFKHQIEDGWAQTLQKCEGIIAFDATVCRGPRHDVELHAAQFHNLEEPRPQNRLLGPAIATVALGPKGCDGCHTSEEGPAIWGESPAEHFPLLTPPPYHSSTLAAARRPALLSGEHPILISRCVDCLADRRCHRCNKWFCSSCLPHPEQVRNNLTPHQTASREPRTGNERLGHGVTKDCWECGPTCASCKLECQRSCQNCQGGYCIEHNEGCSSNMCDWCNTSTRHRMRELY
ncbi:uncharacterized protein BDV14DRAFT_173153 [Aspergillus stella-maris]|uniref:uncharacterized protein n=1 Tax=Aspergillus stella-maris TaxID=1810926 RepID=UPI003CCCFD2F